jgi:hypothetical protein
LAGLRQRLWARRPWRCSSLDSHSVHVPFTLRPSAFAKLTDRRGPILSGVPSAIVVTSRLALAALTMGPARVLRRCGANPVSSHHQSCPRPSRSATEGLRCQSTHDDTRVVHQCSLQKMAVSRRGTTCRTTASLPASRARASTASAGPRTTAPYADGVMA